MRLVVRGGRGGDWARRAHGSKCICRGLISDAGGGISLNSGVAVGCGWAMCQWHERVTGGRVAIWLGELAGGGGLLAYEETSVCCSGRGR